MKKTLSIILTLALMLGTVAGLQLFPAASAESATVKVTVSDATLGYVESANGSTFTAVPYGNHAFAGWYLGDTLVSKMESMTALYDADGNNAYVAKFTKDADTISTGLEEYADGTALVKTTATSSSNGDFTGGFATDNSGSNGAWEMATWYTSESWRSVDVSSVVAKTGNVSAFTDALYSWVGYNLTGLSTNKSYTLTFYVRAEGSADTTLRNCFVAPENVEVINKAIGEGGLASSNSSVLKALSSDALTVPYANWAQKTIIFDTGANTDVTLWMNLQGVKIYIDDIVCVPTDSVQPVTDTGVSVSYINADGTAYAEADQMAAANIISLVDSANSTHTYQMNLDAMSGAFAFQGWYDATGALVSTSPNYSVALDALADTKLTAKVVCNNILVGAGGFEGYQDGEDLRVSPRNAGDNGEPGTAPYDGAWGVYNPYNDASNNMYKGYEGKDRPYYINVVSSDTNKYLPTYTFDAATQTYDGTGETVAYEVTPHSGNHMLKTTIKSRSMIRKIENLKANTTYTVAFYLHNPDPYNYLYLGLVTDTYNLSLDGFREGQANRLSTWDKNTIYGYWQPELVSEYVGVIPELANAYYVRDWQYVAFTFTTKDNDVAYLHFAETYQGNGGNVYLDDLVVFENELSIRGNAIRAASDTQRQALRYKFYLDNDKLADAAEVGLLAIPTDYLGDNELVIGGKYLYDGETRKPIQKTVEPVNYQYADGDTKNTYFTAALTGINTDKYGVSYAVRSYITYGTGDDAYTVYSDTVYASVLNTMYAILQARTNADDVAIVNALLEDPTVKADYDALQAAYPDHNWFTKEPISTDDYDYAMAVIGDVQKTTRYWPDDLYAPFEYVADNAASRKIEYAFTLGDITDLADGTSEHSAEFKKVTAELEKIKTAGVPQSILRGNHDYTEQFDQHVTYDRFGDATLIRKDGTDMKNTYRIIEIGDLKYMMLTLNYDASDEEIAWAAEVVATHPDCNVILSTHSYLEANMTLSSDGGQDIYNGLVSKYSNIVMVLCGHNYVYGPRYITTTRTDGSKVVQMMVNHQLMEYMDARSYGMMAMLYFSNGGSTVTLEFFSALRGDYYMKRNQYTFELDVVRPTLEEYIETPANWTIDKDSATIIGSVANTSGTVSTNSTTTNNTAASLKLYMPDSYASISLANYIKANKHYKLTFNYRFEKSKDTDTSMTSSFYTGVFAPNEEGAVLSGDYYITRASKDWNYYYKNKTFGDNNRSWNSSSTDTRVQSAYDTWHTMTLDLYTHDYEDLHLVFKGQVWRNIYIDGITLTEVQ